jgi:hypothetical protein
MSDENFDNQDDVQKAVSTTVETEGYIGVDPYFATPPVTKAYAPIESDAPEEVESKASVTVVTAPDPLRPGVVVAAPQDEKIETKESAPDEKALSGSVSGAEKSTAPSSPAAPTAPSK